MDLSKSNRVGVLFVHGVGTAAHSDTAMISWSFRYLFEFLARLFEYVSSLFGPARRLTSYSVHDGAWWYRLADLLTTVGHAIGYALLAPVGYLLLIPLAVLAQIPYQPIQSFALLALTRVFLQYNASQLRVYYEDEIQAANMRRRVAEGIRWLMRAESDGGGGCDSVVIVAHSGGVWVAHGMLSDATYAAEAEHVRKFITLGSGLNKIWQVAPTQVRRLYKPITGNLYWIDFWSSYDPVPVGWLEPPRVGAPLGVVASGTDSIGDRGSVFMTRSTRCEENRDCANVLIPYRHSPINVQQRCTPMEAPTMRTR